MQNVLKMSYEALDLMEKSIFLDIACFFKGKDRNFVEGILGDESHIGINVLIERSLITIDSDKRLSMHDLMQKMGWEIIRQESPSEPAHRSRLWIGQDVLHVLQKNNGAQSIEGISFDMSEIHEDICLEPSVFEAMSSLRLLKIYTPFHYTGRKYSKVYLHRGLHYLPNSLRYLRWDMYPSKALPSKFRPESLVELDMRESQLTQLWDGVLHLGNLKHIDLRYSEKLIKIPDLSHSTRLESINLLRCTSLVELPPLNFPFFLDKEYFFYGDPGYLDLEWCCSLKILPKITGNIRFLDLSCTGIKELPLSIRSCNSLFDLDLSKCKNLENFPELPRNIVKLNLSWTSIREMPATSIKCLHRVEKILMRHCKRFEGLPSNFCKLKSLEELDLNGCSNLKIFPEILEPMENLKRIDLSGTGIQELPSSFEKIIHLHELDVEDCRNLKTIPTRLNTLLCFRGYHLSFYGCSKLQIFPAILFGLDLLGEVNLSNCNILEIPHWIGSLSSLSRLNLKGNMFASIPSSIKQLSRLFKLNISDCRNLESLPELPSSAYELIADGCMSIEMVSTSSSFTLHPARSWYRPDNPIFMFCGCLKLKQSACNNIVMNFLCRVIWAIMRTKIYHFREKGTGIRVCYSGNRIPKWMDYQSEGSLTLTIKLPQDWHNSNFSGFVICVVLSIEDPCRCYRHSMFHGHTDSRVDISCELRLQRAKYGRSHYCYRWCLYQRSVGSIDRELLRSDHVFMCYDSLQHDDYSDTVGMSFRFFCEKPSCYCKCPFRYDVKRIGVRMLYFEKELVKEYKLDIKQYAEYMVEAAEIGIDVHQYIHSDLQAASHNVAALEAPSDDDDDDDKESTTSARDSTTIHEEAVSLNYFTCSSAGSDDDQTDNIFEDDSNAMDNMPKPSATPVLNFDTEESWFEIIKCFVINSCSRFLDWIQGNREN